MKIISRFLIAIAITIISIYGCKEDSGFRAISSEVEIGTFSTPEDYLIVGYIKVGNEVALNQVESNMNSKNAITSTAISYPVGSNVPFNLMLQSYIDDMVYEEAPLPCDVIFRVKSDNKIIYEKKYKRGDSPGDTYENGNLIIR
jgi:hypothetical protein